jgi:hypothetical protein
MFQRCFIDLAEAAALGTFLISLWIWAQVLARASGV